MNNYYTLLRLARRPSLAVLTPHCPPPLANVMNKDVSFHSVPSLTARGGAAALVGLSPSGQNESRRDGGTHTQNIATEIRFFFLFSPFSSFRSCEEQRGGSGSHNWWTEPAVPVGPIATLYAAFYTGFPLRLFCSSFLRYETQM